MWFTIVLFHLQFTTPIWIYPFSVNLPVLCVIYKLLVLCVVYVFILFYFKLNVNLWVLCHVSRFCNSYKFEDQFTTPIWIYPSSIKLPVVCVVYNYFVSFTFNVNLQVLRYFWSFCNSYKPEDQFTTPTLIYPFFLQFSCLMYDLQFFSFILYLMWIYEL